MQVNITYQAGNGIKKVPASPYSVDPKEELAYRVEEEIDTELSPPFRDVSHSLAQGLTQTLYSAGENHTYPTRRQALEQHFEKPFMERELRRVKGNITQYVRDAFDLDDPTEINKKRRNVYRQIEEHGLKDIVDASRPWKQSELEEKLYTGPKIEPGTVESTLTGTLAGYKDTIHPTIYQDLNDRIREKAPSIAERVSEYLPTPDKRLRHIFETTEGITIYDKAKNVFERQVVYDALDAAGWDKKKAAGYLGDSLRTLNRRIAELGIGKEDDQGNPAEEEARKDNMVQMEDFVRDRQEKTGQGQMPEGAVDEIERFQQLVRQYNEKREAERLRREGKEKRKKQARWKRAA